MLLMHHGTLVGSLYFAKGYLKLFIQKKYNFSFSNKLPIRINNLLYSFLIFLFSILIPPRGYSYITQNIFNPCLTLYRNIYRGVVGWHFMLLDKGVSGIKIMGFYVFHVWFYFYVLESIFIFDFCDTFGFHIFVHVVNFHNSLNIIFMGLLLRLLLAYCNGGGVCF